MRFLVRFLVCLAALAALQSISPTTEAATRVVGNLPRAENRPLEDLPGLDTEYGELLPGDGARLRTIVTRPQQSSGRLPAVLFVQWLSCDTIELRPNAPDGWSVMLRRLISESGMLWQRTEKSGVGDSQGTQCAQLDYEKELAHHRAALRQLRSRPDVDPRKIVVFGASMGSNYAPLVAAGEDVAGVVVWGGGATTWFERMLRFERNALELGDTKPEALADEVNARAAFFARYLLRGETPKAIAAGDPKLGEVWGRIVGTSETGHYGRPFAFHQQAQRQNWTGAWSRVRAPVLVLYGEYDWFESHDAAQLIADVVNARQPGSATFRELPQLDHHFTRYASRRDTFQEKDGKENAAPAVTAILDWLTKIGARPRDSRAKNVLDRGVDALGGSAALAAVGTIRREFFDAWVDPSQGQRPWHGGPDELPPANSGFERTPVVTFIDYGRDRWLETQKYIDSPQEYALVLDAVSAGRGFRSIKYRDEKPFFDELAAGDLPGITARTLRRHPEGILRMALARADTLEWISDNVISFADPLDTRVRLYFDAQTHLLTKAETARDHPLMGSTTSETIEKAMSIRGLKPTIEVASQQRVFDAGNVRARVYDFGPAPHVAQILGAYFPDEKLLYVADLMDVLTEELVIAGVDAVPMRRKIRELGLKVERFVPVHGLPISGEQLEAAYRIRAKYGL